MNIARVWWQKICEPLDGFLWRKDISHPIIRPLIRNEIMACGLCMLAGAAVYAVFSWLFWFGAGICCMTWLFWSWARFFLRRPPQNYGPGSLMPVIMRFGLRMIVVAALLFLALAVFRAAAAAILAGLVTGAVLALVSYAWNMKAQG